MRIASWRKTEIRCPFPVFLILPAAILLNSVDSFLTAFFSLALHELAHSFMAQRLGYSVAALEIQPFGFIARLTEQPSSPSEAIAVYASGPMASLLSALISAGFMQFTGEISAALKQFASFNLMLGAVNLFPVLPLDGGRLLVSLFAKTRSSKRIIKLFSAFGILAGAGFTILGILLFTRGTRNFTVIITGFFIMLAAARELKMNAFTIAETKLTQLSRLRHGRSPLRVYATAVNYESSVRTALGVLSHGGYNLILLIDSFGKVCGALDESELMDALAVGKADKRISEIFAEKGGRRVFASETSDLFNRGTGKI